MSDGKCRHDALFQFLTNIVCLTTEELMPCTRQRWFFLSRHSSAAFNITITRMGLIVKMMRDLLLLLVSGNLATSFHTEGKTYLLFLFNFHFTFNNNNKVENGKSKNYYATYVSNSNNMNSVL